MFWNLSLLCRCKWLPENILPLSPRIELLSWSKLHMSTWYNNPCILFLIDYFLFSVTLHSFADQSCSARVSCDLDVHDFIKLFHPCPRELSSYLEASYICIPGKFDKISKLWINKNVTNVNLHSFADKRCSGTSSCQIKVHEFLEKFYPCPRELSSYLEASYLCLPGNTSTLVWLYY